jgi:hypothetical protein
MQRRLNISAPLLVSLAGVALIGLVVMSHGPALLRAALGPSSGLTDPQATLTALVEEHDRDFETYVSRFNGRSFFFKPSPWPQPRPAPAIVSRPAPPPAEAAPAPAPAPTGPPPPPATYSGPKVLFAVGESVEFQSDRTAVKSFQVAVGEEKEGIRVIAVNLPWSVKLGYRGGEYDVEILAPSDLFKDVAPPPPSATPGLVEATAAGTDDAGEEEDDGDVLAGDVPEEDQDAASTSIAEGSGNEQGEARPPSGLAAGAGEGAGEGDAVEPTEEDTEALSSSRLETEPSEVEIYGPPEPPGLRLRRASAEGAASPAVRAAAATRLDPPASESLPAIDGPPAPPPAARAPEPRIMRQPGGRPAPEQRPPTPGNPGAIAQDRTALPRGRSHTSDPGTE